MTKKYRNPNDSIGAALAFWRSLVELDRNDCGDLNGVPWIRRHWPGITDDVRHWMFVMLDVIQTKEWKPTRKCVVRFPGNILPTESKYGNSVVWEWDVPPQIELPNWSPQIDAVRVQDGIKYPFAIIETTPWRGNGMCPDIQVDFSRFRV